MEMEYEKQIAKAALEINAIKLNPDNPFTWASDYKMPIYNDNREFLGYPKFRRLIAQAFKNKIESQNINYHSIIAGVATSGIPPATTLADYLDKPLVYVRDKQKEHGLKNKIEGISVEGKQVLLIEDLISTGGSSAKAVQVIRDEKGYCNNCISIFTYGLKKAEKIFQGEEPFDKEGNKLSPECETYSLLTFDALLEVAKEIKYINNSQLEMLLEWQSGPFNWGEKHNFTKTN